MASTHDTAGVVLNSAGTTVLDTRDMPWERPSPTARSFAKVLMRDADGDPVLQMKWHAVRPDQSEKMKAAYHLGREFLFMLGGELPSWECDVDEDGRAVGTAITLWREGYYLDRQPGSLHGQGAQAKQIVDIQWLGWMTVSEDPYVGLYESQALTDELPTGRPRSGLAIPNGQHRAPAPAAAVRYERGGIDSMYLLSTRDLDWESHPMLPGSHIKVLSRRADGDPTVILWTRTAGPFQEGASPARYSPRYREVLYVVEGELPVVHYEDADDTDGRELLLRQGYWVERRPGSMYGYPAGDCGATGATVLQMRFRSDAILAKGTETHARWSRSVTNKPTGSSGPEAIAASSEGERLAFLRERAKLLGLHDER